MQCIPSATHTKLSVCGLIGKPPDLGSGHHAGSKPVRQTKYAWQWSYDVMPTGFHSHLPHYDYGYVEQVVGSTGCKLVDSERVLGSSILPVSTKYAGIDKMVTSPVFQAGIRKDIAGSSPVACANISSHHSSDGRALP